MSRSYTGLRREAVIIFTLRTKSVTIDTLARKDTYSMMYLSRRTLISIETKLLYSSPLLSRARFLTCFYLAKRD